MTLTLSKHVKNLPIENGLVFMLSHYWIKRRFKLTKMFKKSKFHFFKIDSKMDLDNL